MDGSSPPAWHQALAFAVTGVRFEDLGRQTRPDLDALTALLRTRLGVDVDPAVLSRAHPLPAPSLHASRTVCWVLYVPPWGFAAAVGATVSMR